MAEITTVDGEVLLSRSPTLTTAKLTDMPDNCFYREHSRTWKTSRKPVRNMVDDDVCPWRADDGG